jgi:hypothetical protein
MQAGDGSFESSDHKVLTEHIKVAHRVFLINLQAKQRPAQAAPLLGPLTPTTLAQALAGTCQSWLCQNTVLKPPKCIHICIASTHKVWSPKAEGWGGGPGACLTLWMMLSGTFCCAPPLGRILQLPQRWAKGPCAVKIPSSVPSSTWAGNVIQAQSPKPKGQRSNPKARSHITSHTLQSA